MKMGTLNLKENIAGTEQSKMNTTVVVERPSNSPPIVQPKQDLNMTAPLHTDQVKNGRRMANEFVASPLNQTVVNGK